MPETTLLVGAAQLGTVSIDPLRIDASGGATFPVVQVPVRVALAPVPNRTAVAVNEPAIMERNYTLFMVTGRALFQPFGAYRQFRVWANDGRHGRRYPGLQHRDRA